MAMARATVAMLLCAAGPALAMQGLRGSVDQQGLDVTGMQPGVVSHLLSEVEHSWEGQALQVLRGAQDNATSIAAVQKSCQKIARSIVDGSAGNKERVSEYLKDVCAVAQEGHDASMCLEFSKEVESFMTDDDFRNREELDYTRFCAGFYNGAVSREAAQAQKEAEAKAKAEREAEAERQRQEAAFQAAEHAAKTRAQVQAAAKKVEEAAKREQAAQSLQDSMGAEEREVDKAQEAARQEVQHADEKEVEAAEAQAKQAAEQAAQKRAAAEKSAAVAAEKAKAEKEEMEKRAQAEKKAVEEAQEKAKAEAKALAEKQHQEAKEKQKQEEAKEMVEEGKKKVEKVEKAQEKKAALVVKDAGVVDPCKSITCGPLKCPVPSKITNYPGHCCPYCVSDAVLPDTKDYSEKAKEAYATYKTAPYR